MNKNLFFFKGSSFEALFDSFKILVITNFQEKILGSFLSGFYSCPAIRTHLWKKRRDHGARDFLLTLQLHQHHHWPATVGKSRAAHQCRGRGVGVRHHAEPSRDPGVGHVAGPDLPADAVLLHHLIRKLNVRVAVAEAGHVRDLAV